MDQETQQRLITSNSTSEEDGKERLHTTAGDQEKPSKTRKPKKIVKTLPSQTRLGGSNMMVNEVQKVVTTMADSLEPSNIEENSDEFTDRQTTPMS